MRYSGKVFPLLFLLGIWCASCGPAGEEIRWLGSAGGEPTSIVIPFQTPKPTRTSLPTQSPVPTITPNEDPINYYGGLTISLDDVGRTVVIRRLESFLLQLGDAYTWTVELDPADLVTHNLNITPEPGDQGVFIARERGQVLLKAVGTPACRQADPPCERPDVLFQVIIVVQ
jgi:hypothetical protein